MPLNIGEANAVLLLHDLIGGGPARSEQQVVDALQLLVAAAGKRLQVRRAPVEVRDTAVRLVELTRAPDGWMGEAVPDAAV